MASPLRYPIFAPRNYGSAALSLCLVSSSTQDVNGTLVVNPGRLTKFRSGGTYGHLRIDAPRRNDIPTNNEPLRAGVSERATVQIRRI